MTTIQDNVEIQPINEPTETEVADNVVEEQHVEASSIENVEAPKPKAKARAKAKPRAKKVVVEEPLPPPPEELERQETNVEELKPAKRPTTRKKSIKPEPEPFHTVEESNSSIVPPTPQQTALYLQNQKMMKMKKKLAHMQSLISQAV